MEQNFSEDLLFWQKNGTKLLDPTVLFLCRTAALFTGCQNFRKSKKFHIAHENVDSNVSAMFWSTSGKKNCGYFTTNKAILLALRFAA